ncbi:hypothetical protein A0257_19155 [Hymenobacter psoromatis]|nr:hypothetical protein A0257_19155 [Hymenobacter psoromatis]
MQLLYVDESGDPGISSKSPSAYFFLAGLLLDASDWTVFTNNLLAFRQRLARRYGLPVSEEIHASVFLSNRTAIAARISANDRLRILLECLEWCAASPYLRLLTVGLDKRQRTNSSAFTEVWAALYHLFDETLASSQPPTTGLVLCDNTDGAKLTHLVQALQRPSEAGVAALQYVIEEPVFRDSHRSYLHQLADVAAYFAKQAVAPSNFIRDKGASQYFARLDPINLLKKPSESSLGIQML